MTTPSPRENPLLFGHQDADIVLMEALRMGRVHHAWLITGPAGIGKATLAFRFARTALAGKEITPDHPVFRRVAMGSHADLLTVERAYDEKRQVLRSEIVVDDVRAIGHFLHLTPAEGGWRIVVLDGAESLNRNAANALLKILEEPPPRALLLLVCAAPGRIPATIRSRCRRLRLSPLDEPAMRAALAVMLPDHAASERDRLAALAEGAPGRALALADGNGLTLSDLARQTLTVAPRLPMTRGDEIMDQLGKIDEGFSTFMDLLCAGLAAAARQAARREGMTASLDAMGQVWQGLCSLRDDTDRFNLDKRQAVISAVALLNTLP